MDTITRDDPVMASVRTTRRDDGCILVQTDIDYPSTVESIPGRLAYWSRVSPAAIFLSDDERVISYLEAETLRRSYSAYLLNMSLSANRPLMILGDNSINHALIMLAATAVGIPVAVVSPAYAAPTAAPWEKLARVIGQVGPGCVLVDNEPARQVVANIVQSDVAVLSLRNLAWLETYEMESAETVAAAERAVSGDTIAKLLFTSGSIGAPKPVINTQRMMATNMAALSVMWPGLSAKPPVLVDWLPWNHTFGGNCCFNLSVWFGGHLHIDAGRPNELLIGKTIDAIKRHRPTMYFNVPIGYSLLASHCERDRDFAAAFFDGLDFLFNAGAAMPESTRLRLENIAIATSGRRARLFGGWGSTETAPFSTALCFDTDQAGNLGIPIPGVVIKMVPDRDRYELRVKGPNVMPGYWRNPEATAAAFDEEGYFRIGDAGKFADPADPSAGILFDGRVAENFKLSSGTFVNVGKLRLAVISAGEKLIADVVVAGEGHAEIGLLIFLNEPACRALIVDNENAVVEHGEIALAQHPIVLDRLATLLAAYNATTTGSSTRIACFAIAEEPPSPAHDEITEKGYINQRRVLMRRAEQVKQLFISGIRV